MTVPSQLLDELVAAVADELERRVRAVLDSQPTISSPSFRLWNVEEAAAALGRSERWLRERVKRGELPFVKLDGGALAFLPADVEAFAVSRRVAPVLARRLQAVSDPSVSPGGADPDRVLNRRVQS